MAKTYYRLMLGAGGCYAAQCLKECYVGVNFGIDEDLSGKFVENWKKFNEKYIPIYLKYNPGNPKVTAGLACAVLWRIGWNLKNDDVVFCPNGNGEYLIGIIDGDYYYVHDTELPHRRHVKWLDKTIRRSDMSDNLKHCTGAIGTCIDASQYAEEIEYLIGISTSSAPKSEEKTTVKDPFHERDLHRLFCTYLRSDEIISKTIYHEKSTYRDKEQRWVHPDIVGVQFMDFGSDSTKNLVKSVDPQEQVKFYSYELKRRITSDNELKEYFFQALSNSSWAHYGYLVAFEIDETLYDEIKRLNNAFGIGVILLQAHKEDTQVLFQARENKLDYYTIDKICGINADFRTFIQKSISVLTASKQYHGYEMSVLEKDCDVILADDEIDKYCQDNNIPY